MRAVSGIQPTASLHLGNYLGALRHWIELQAAAECIFMVADLHAITTVREPGVLHECILDTGALLLALGINPERSVVFLQSRVPQHAELAWVLNCFTGVGELRRMAQFKEKSVDGNESRATVGLFAYPVLQAADILLYQADRVPIGEDQKQHLELARAIATRFNHHFPGTFRIPEPLIAADGARIMDLHDPRKKMSKSAQSAAGVIFLTDSPEAIRSKILAATTDSGHELRSAPDKPGISNLIAIHSILTGSGQQATEAGLSGKTYAEFKRILADELIEHLRPVREQYQLLRQERRYLEHMLLEGSYRAQSFAIPALVRVYQRVGFLEPPYREAHPLRA